MEEEIKNIAKILHEAGVGQCDCWACNEHREEIAKNIYTTHVKPLEEELKHAEAERDAALLEACDYGKECVQAKDLLIEALERLARLGNGTEYGNSIGNIIAQEALAKVKEQA